MNDQSDYQESLENAVNWLWEFAPNLIGAILITIIGFWLIRQINRLVRKFFTKKEYDLTLEKFMADFINWSLKLLLFVLVISQLGVKSTSLIAILGAASLAIGLALQGSLANFAGGVLILLFKPFEVGHFIQAQGIEGTVKEISIFYTKLLTFGNQQAIIPNGKLSNESVINYTIEGIRRDKLTLGISYDSDIKLAKEILMDLINEQELIIKEEDRMPMVVVEELADSSVNLSVRYWAKNEDFWNVRFFTIEQAKSRLEAADIVIPFPQRDVHMHQV
jgi:small conductance mechanosensitive channel